MAEAFLDHLVRTTPSAEVRTGLAAVARAMVTSWSQTTSFCNQPKTTQKSLITGSPEN
jgi:hypothetical protein